MTQRWLALSLLPLSLAARPVAAAPDILTAPLPPMERDPTEPGGRPKAEAAAARKYVVERFDDTAVVQVYADGFARLPPQSRVLAYHLARAAIAGDVIYYDQNNADNLDVKAILDGLMTRPRGVDKAVREKILRYALRFYAHRGRHEADTGRKFLPAFTFEELQAAAKAALRAGADFGVPDEAALLARLGGLRAAIFDPAQAPAITVRTAPAGGDILSASANNLYQGVRQADLAGFRERYPLNSKLVRDAAGLTELVWRAGTDTVAPGLYADPLRAVVQHLEAALPAAEPRQAKALRELTTFLQTGDPAAFRRYNLLWVKDDPRVEAILGFIENARDARGAKGSFEGLVLIRDAVRTEQMQALAAAAPYFEARAPWADAWKRRKFQPPGAAVYQVVAATGEAAAMTPAGINLPNEQAIREKHGSRNFILSNVNEAVEQAFGQAFIDEFAASPAEAAEQKRCGQSLWDTIVGLHEVTGHGSGKVSPKLKGDPMAVLQETGGAIEEARANLVALWHASDPKVVELGLLPDAKCAAALPGFFALVLLRRLMRVSTGEVLEQEHMRAEHLIVSWAMAKGALRESWRGGKVYLEVPDPAAFRAAAGELLAEIMRIKAEGDLDAGRRLLAQHGTRFNPKWRDDAVRRAAAIGYPRRRAFLFPRLEPRHGESGEVVDAVVSYPSGLVQQNLEYVGKVPGL